MRRFIKLSATEIVLVCLYSLVAVAGIVGLCVFQSGCAHQGVPTTACAYQGNGEVCVLIVVGKPQAVFVERVHLGMWQTYVANVPIGWVLHHEFARWPRMIPNACLDDYDLCRWMVVEEGAACERLKLLPNVQPAAGW